MVAQLREPSAIAFVIVGLFTALVSSRYYTSAAFEHPTHFSILTFLIVSAFLVLHPRVFGRPAYHEPSRASDNFPTRSISGKPGWVNHVCELLHRLLIIPRRVLILVLCLILRTVLFSRILDKIHCSWNGFPAFLPFVVSAYGLLEGQGTLLLRNEYQNKVGPSWAASNASLYILVALLWGFATADTVFLIEPLTGAICPPVRAERMIPLAQLVMLGSDAMIIIQIGHIRRTWEGKTKAWEVLGYSFLSSAVALVFLALYSNRVNFRWNDLFTYLSIGNLVMDSVFVSTVVATTIYLLARIDNATVALFIIGISVLVQLESRAVDGTLAVLWSHWRAFVPGLAVFLAAGVLFQLSDRNSHGSIPRIQKSGVKNRVGGYMFLTFILVLAQSVYFQNDTEIQESVGLLIAQSKTRSQDWITGAKKSKTLSEAVLEYRQRYGIPPPPNFDKWYKFAISADSPIIDDFTQIHSDLLPYWGVSPQLLRERTTHLLTHPSYSFGGLIIEKGRIEISPHIRGTHRWMMEVMQSMIEPFSEWLPDMHLAFNLDDECRVSLLFNHSNANNGGLESQDRLASHHDFHGFSKSQDPPWDKEFLLIEDEGDRAKLWDKQSPWFQVWSKSRIFDEWISSTCPPNAWANQLHWWNRKAACLSCSEPHMMNGVVSNWTMSGDVCHQPDLALLHGFSLSPSAMAATHILFPVFSQSRVGNFADILYPNPWNFGDKVQYSDEKAVTWQQKLNSVFWRGGASDGYTANGAWHTFMRARFVYMAQKFKSLSGNSVLSFMHRPLQVRTSVAVNVSFVGQFSRCDEPDCTTEHTTFYGSQGAEPAPSLDFQEHWKHRHLVDLDGAAFSGRFLPFLKSGSLPYRAALFRTWWEERVHPWRHFVPVDVRLHDLWKLVSYFGGPGDQDAETIAREGSEWAQRALRKEDMQVYMFRLLLEWGRLVDDRREELGFVTQ